jgi:insertion element IS1 protein InsB
MWSFVQKKDNQRRLWFAIDHNTHAVLAYTFGKRKDEVLRKPKLLLKPFGITMFYTDDWGSYERNLDPKQHTIGKNTHRLLSVKTLHLEHVSRDYVEKPSVFLNLFKCMILSWVLS